MVRDADGREGYAVTMTGSATWGLEARDRAEADLRRAELIGVPIAIVILLLVFGAVAAALIPLALAVVAIVVALALTVAMGAGFEVSVFAVNIITVMGLAVGIDYSLLIVSRFREERRAGRGVAAAIRGAGATASRAVFFSGGIVVLALTGMLIVPYSIFTSLGAGAHLRRPRRGRRGPHPPARPLPSARRPRRLGKAGVHQAPGHGRGRTRRLLDARRARHDAQSCHRPRRRMRDPRAPHAAALRDEDRHERGRRFPGDTSAKQAYVSLKRDFSVGLGRRSSW